MTATIVAFIILAACNAGIAFTITRSKLTHYLREWIGEKASENAFWLKLSELITCSFCFQHWVAFVQVAVFQDIRFTHVDPMTDALLVAFALPPVGCVFVRAIVVSYSPFK